MSASRSAWVRPLPYARPAMIDDPVLISAADSVVGRTFQFKILSGWSAGSRRIWFGPRKISHLVYK